MLNSAISHWHSAEVNTDEKPFALTRAASVSKTHFLAMEIRGRAPGDPPFIKLVTPLCVWLVMVAPGLAAEPDEWKAGVAKVAITPREPVWMSGYEARNGPSDITLVDLHARALVLADTGNTQLAIVTLDLIEIPDTLRKCIVDVVRTNHGIKPEELLLNVSHSHGGPMVSAKTVADWGIAPV